MIPGNDVTVATRRGTVQKVRRHKPIRCSICTRTIWFHPIALQEPPGAPEPRRAWVLCRTCHEILLTHMRLSPVRSPLRLRIALGLVAAERSPEAYGVGSRLRDQRRFIAIAWVLLIAMVLHLVVIVLLATLR
jgi:hypothetical protein